MDKILKQEIERTKKVKQEYFDRKEVQDFGNFVHSLLEIRTVAEGYSELFLNYIFAIGWKEWWDNAPRDRSFFKATSKRIADNVAELVSDLSRNDSELYSIIRDYFKLFYGFEDEAAFVKLMKQYILDHSKQIHAVIDQLFPTAAAVETTETTK